MEKINNKINKEFQVDLKKINKSSDLSSSTTYKIKGYANVYNITDNHNDIIIKGAFENLNSTENIKLLWQHMTDKPIGKIIEIKQDDYGLFVVAEINLNLTLGKEIANLIESGAINGLSIGFSVEKSHINEQSIRVITKAKLWEISIVTFPANEHAQIIKNYGENFMENSNKTKIDNIYNYEFSEENMFSIKNYLRQGDTSIFESKSLSSENDSAGYTIPSEFRKKILSEITSSSIMRKLASVETISSNMLELLITEDRFNSGWVNETNQRDVTDNAKIVKKQIHVHELYAQPKATQRLLDDNEVNIENWLIEHLKEEFLETENNSFINGDGENKPKGILSYPNEQIKQIAATNQGQIIFEDLLKLMSELPEKYLKNASFLMHRSTLAHLRTLKDNNGRFIWQPQMGDYCENIFGIKIFTSDEMPKMEENSLAIILADFKSAYKIVDRKNIKIMRDPYTEKPFVKFYATKRVGGDVVNFNAIRILKI